MISSQRILTWFENDSIFPKLQNKPDYDYFIEFQLTIDYEQINEAAWKGGLANNIKRHVKNTFRFQPIG